MTDKENKWIKFYPSLELPKERVSIAYATHDERGYRFAYGYFQFYNGTCGCFWKDGNEQPKVVKAEDIKYWMSIPSLDIQEEPKDKCKGCNNVKGCITCVDGSEYAHIEECDITGIKSKHATGKLKELVDNISEEGLEEARKQLEELTKECMYSKDNYTDEDRKALCDGCEEECIEKINEERKRDLSLWSLGDFENNFFEIIKPYKDSRNYKNLCIRLVVWRSELWRWIHWKKRKEEPVSEQNLSNVGRTGKNWKESVSKAAEDYSKSTLVGSPYIKKNAFKAGADWQKEKAINWLKSNINCDIWIKDFIKNMEE